MNKCDHAPTPVAYGQTPAVVGVPESHPRMAATTWSKTQQSTLDTRKGVMRIALFFLITIALAYTTDLLVNIGLRRVNTSGFGVTNKIVGGAIDADIIISGSSRALVHYDPRIIQGITGRSTFNIGRNGSQTDLQVAVLKSYLTYNTKPNLIIHNLDLYSFITSREIYDPAQYMPYLSDPAIYAGVCRVYSDAWKWKYLPLYAYLVEDMRFTWIKGIKALVGL